MAPTSSSPSKPEWQFRSTLNASETLGIIADPSTLAAFSPDIIPLDQIRASPNEIAACYNYFVAHSIDRDEEKTFVYIRTKVALPTGYSSSNAESSQVDLLAIPNELILWPATWGKKTTPLQGHTNLDMKNIIGHRNIVVGHPISYKPIVLPDNGQHSHETLVAVRTSSNARYQSVVAKVNNWRDLVNHVGKNNDISFYNAMAADPHPERVTLTTKLRILENERPFVDLYLGIEAVGTPSKGVVAVIRVGDGISTIFTIGPQPLLPSKDFGGDIRLPANFSGTVTLEVLNNAKETFCDYSSISIVLYAVDNSSAGTSNHVLIGADHIFFDSNPRVKRLVRKYRPSFLRTEATENVDDTPHFYFRDAIGDSANFPRDENISRSPDIQPVGNYPLTDPLSTFSDQNVDYSTQQNYGITSGESNYVYVCGHTTTAHEGDIRLFIIPSSVLLLPSIYNTPECTVYDIDLKTKAPTTAIRKYDMTSNGTQQVLTTEPFLIDGKNPPPDSDHYCLVAECKPHRTQEEKDEGDLPYEWPHDETGDFWTMGEFDAWILNEPRVAWRNMNFRDNSDGGSDYSVRQSFKLFPGVSSTDTLRYNIRATDCPIGSQYSMDSTDPAIQCGKTVIETNDEGTFAEFTGKDSSFSCQVVLRWYSNGYSRNSGQRIYGELSHPVRKTSVVAKSKQQLSKSKFSQKIIEKGPQSKTQKRKLYVGDAYPSVIAPKNSRVPGRLRIGGAIRARRLTSSKKPIIAKDNLDGYYSDGSDSGSSSSGSLEAPLEDIILGTDTAQTF